MATERLFIRSDDAAAHSLDHSRCLGRNCCRLLNAAFCGTEAFRAGFGFARASSSWCMLNHASDSILVPAGHVQSTATTQLTNSQKVVPDMAPYGIRITILWSGP